MCPVLSACLKTGNVHKSEKRNPKDRIECQNKDVPGTYDTNPNREFLLALPYSPLCFLSAMFKT